MSTADGTGGAGNDDCHDTSRSEDVILTPEDRKRITEAVRDVIPQKRFRLADTGGTPSYETTYGSVSPSSSVHAQQRDDQTVSIDQEEGGEIHVRSIGGTETREEHHAGRMKLSLTSEQDRSGSGSQLQVRGGDTQTLATADKSSVINIQELHLHQTNVKNENCSAVSVGGNVTVSSGTKQETLAPQARRQLTQAQEELKAMRESTSKQLREWTTDMVHTKAVDVLVEQLSKGPSVYILKGQPGEGKTTVAKMALKKLQDKGREVFVVTTPAEYFTVKSVKESVILLNDIFGDSYFHLDNVSTWKNVFVDYLALQEHKDESQSKSKPTILLVSRSTVLDSAAKYLGRFCSLILNEDCTMDLTKNIKYSIKEKIKIWSYYAHRYKVDLEEGIVLGVCKMNHPHGFPHCCRLFAEMYSKSQQLKMETFFLKPLEFLQQELESVLEDDIAGMVLRQMLKNGGIYVANSLSERHEKSFHVKKVICKYEGLYFRKEGNEVTFHHPSIYDAVAFIVGKVDPLFVVQNCNLTFLNDRVRFSDLSGPETEHQRTVHIDSSCKQQFMDRMKYEITEGNISGVLSHASFHDEHFVGAFMGMLVSGNVQHKTEVQVLHDIMHIMDKKTGHSFLFLSSKNMSNKILKYICERIALTQEDQTSVLFGICSHRSEASLQYFLEMFPECDLSVRNEEEETLLIVAAKNPCDNILRTLMHRGVNVQEEDLRGNTALHYVCEYGVERDPSIVEMMAKKGADVNKCSYDTDTPLSIDGEGGLCKLIATLLHTGADINEAGPLGRTPLTTACMQGFNAVVTTLLDRGADRNKPGVGGETPLTAACLRGFNTVVTTLLDRRSDINKPNRLGETPLAAACRRGHNTVVTTLLDRGANINQPGMGNEKPLTVALRSDHNAVVTTLLDRGSDGNKPGGWREAPLIVACRAGQNTKVITLLDRGADIDKPVGGGETPLTAASKFGHNIVVVTLLDRGAVINKPDEHGETPLTVACRRGVNTVVTTLLDRGADRNEPGGWGQTPLTSACMPGHNNVVITLLDRGADSNRPGVWGETPLTAVCRLGNNTVVSTLLDKGADINQPDRNGETPLTAACRWNNKIVVTTLLDKGADRNKPCGKGKTPLTVACGLGRNNVVSTLLDKGVDINQPDREGDTPLTAACRHGSNTVVTTLLDKGVDIYQPDGGGEMPVTVACRWGHYTVVSTLLDKGAGSNQPDIEGATH